MIKNWTKSGRKWTKSVKMSSFSLKMTFISVEMTCEERMRSFSGKAYIKKTYESLYQIRDGRRFNECENIG